tara:strand:+ start:379 stop:540 length:162 start_codon:yes stop_codon:yes gene_type:complete
LFEIFSDTITELEKKSFWNIKNPANNIKDIKAAKKRLFLKTEFTKDKKYYYLR